MKKFLSVVISLLLVGLTCIQVYVALNPNSFDLKVFWIANRYSYYINNANQSLGGSAAIDHNNIRYAEAENNRGLTVILSYKKQEENYG